MSLKQVLKVCYFFKELVEKIILIGCTYKDSYIEQKGLRMKRLLRKHLPEPS